MKNICLYLHVHQPYRIKNYTVFDIGFNDDYFNKRQFSNENKEIFNKVTHKSYIPMGKLLNKLSKEHKDFNVNLSITGTLIEQAKKYNPYVLKLFKNLKKRNSLEILAETYYHSLAALYSKKEFTKQVKKHVKTIKKEFNLTPKFFRNTELIYSDHIAQMVEDMGFSGVLAEGTEKILHWRSPNYMYKTNTKKGIKLLLKNYKLSDDIAWRFSNKGWEEYPLNADKYLHWIDNTEGENINLFMDFETFGEHQWEDTKVFDFMYHFVSNAIKRGYKFVKVSDTINTKAKDKIECPFNISWADEERDTSAWTENPMQQSSLIKLYELESMVKKKKSLLKKWRYLQTSDHFYYMCTKWFNDGDAHKYFSPYSSPYEAFNNFNNCLIDLKQQLKEV